VTNRPRRRVDRTHLEALLGRLGLFPVEVPSLAELIELLTGLSDPPGADENFSRFRELQENVLTACTGDDPETLEERFLELYAHLHTHEAPYTRGERRSVDASGGYWAHAGGLSPILRAGPWLGPGTRSVDLGAGNGLQGLLMQKLHPHRSCCQVEISGAMVEIGRRLQHWLRIPPDRIEWRVADVMKTPLGGWDFVYLYRPVRPNGPGRVFYERLSEALAAESGQVVVFSIADCLGDFLPPAFDRFFSDGHLTCYRKPPTNR